MEGFPTVEQRLFMPYEINEDQLVHYFAGECSEKESARIEAWIDADPDRKTRVAKLRQIWEAAGRDPEYQPDVDAMWSSLVRRLGPFHSQQKVNPQQKGAGEMGSSRNHKSRNQTTLQRRGERGAQKMPSASKPEYRALAYRALVGVASVILLSLLVWGVYSNQLLDRSAPSMRTITTEVGQRAQIQLGDGTRVTLNAESELTLPPRFGERKRHVRLQGQAYFEVEPDEERPFIVHAGGSVTRVLGTEFDVGAYPGDEAVRVVVAEGTVAVRSELEDEETRVTLRERQMAYLSKSDQSVTRQEVDPSPYIAWTKGELVFRDAPFNEVIQRFRSWYGLRVKLVGSVDAVDHLNASFKEESIDEVLVIVAETLDLEYQREGETVTFSAEE
jgi:ferric-dicitrate binding protein FerR (iron transport regulator)